MNAVQNNKKVGFFQKPWKVKYYPATRAFKGLTAVGKSLVNQECRNCPLTHLG